MNDSGAEKFTGRVNITIPREYHERFRRAVSAEPHLSDAAWAVQRVIHALDIRARGNILEEVEPAEQDVLAGLRFLRREDESTWAGVVGLLASARHFPPAKERVVEVARAFRRLVDEGKNPTPRTSPKDEPPQRPGDPKKRREP